MEIGSNCGRFSTPPGAPRHCSHCIISQASLCLGTPSEINVISFILKMRKLKRRGFSHLSKISQSQKGMHTRMGLRRSPETVLSPATHESGAFTQDGTWRKVLPNWRSLLLMLQIFISFCISSRDRSGCWTLKCKQTPCPSDQWANPSKQIFSAPIRFRDRDVCSRLISPQTLSTCMFFLLMAIQ